MFLPDILFGSSIRSIRFFYSFLLLPFLSSPETSTEIKDQHTTAITFPPRKKGALVVQTSKGKDKFYEFDTTFQPNATQEQVAAQVMPLVQSAIDGFNVCIFAYGQTGSGKTYTMTGADGGKLNKEEVELYGITPRSIVELFKISQASGHHEIQFYFSMVELYRGELLDLFKDKNDKNKKKKSTAIDKENATNGGKKNAKKMKEVSTKLSVKRDPATGVVHIENVNKIQVDSPEALHALIKRGNDSRHTSSTKMNDTSSRSHLVMTIYCESRNTTSNVTTSGKLNLVDLAGSERQSKTGATGAVFEESKSINKSLSVRYFIVVVVVSCDSVVLLCFIFMLHIFNNTPQCFVNRDIFFTLTVFDLIFKMIWRLHNYRR
jgi:hypothetical protein